jgi:hypothetical protein
LQPTQAPLEIPIPRLAAHQHFPKISLSLEISHLQQPKSTAHHQPTRRPIPPPTASPPSIPSHRTTITAIQNKMAKDKSSSKEKDKSSKKEKKEMKLSEENGVTKPSKKEKKDKSKKRDLEAKIAEADVNGDITGKADDADMKEEDEGDEKKEKMVVIGAIVPFANPLCDEKATKKVLKGVKRGMFFLYFFFSALGMRECYLRLVAFDIFNWFLNKKLRLPNLARYFHRYLSTCH